MHFKSPKSWFLDTFTDANTSVLGVIPGVYWGTAGLEFWCIASIMLLNLEWMKLDKVFNAEIPKLRPFLSVSTLCLYLWTQKLTPC